MFVYILVDDLKNTIKVVTHHFNLLFLFYNIRYLLYQFLFYMFLILILVLLLNFINKIF